MLAMVREEVSAMIALPYRPGDVHGTRLLTLLPEKLTIDGKIAPERRRRAAPVLVELVGDDVPQDGHRLS